MTLRSFRLATGRLLLLAVLGSAAASVHAQSGATPVSKDAQASRLYEDALTRFDKKDFAGAIIQLKNALKIDNKSIATQALLGKALLANSDVVAAEVALVEALRLGINRAEVVVPLAQALVAQGKQQEVLSSPKLATAGLPPATLAALLLIRAGATGDLADPKAALRLVEESRAIDPNSPDSWLSEVPIRIRARQFAEATVAADKAVAQGPGQAEPLYVRGTVAHAQNDLAAAMAWYNKALQIQPDHLESLLARAGLHTDARRHEDAKRDIAALMAASKTEPRGAYLRALIAEREGDVKAARDAYNQVTALLDPVPPEFLRYRPQLLMLGGLSHHALRQTEKAKPYLEAVTRIQPTSPVNKLLAQIHLAEGNADRAIEALNNYLRAYPRDSQAILLLASTHMSLGRHARATQLTQDALKLEESPDMRATLGLSLVGAGKIGNAVPELEAVIKRNPTHIQAGASLVSIYLMGEQFERAQRLADSLVKAHPKNPALANLLGMARKAAGDPKGARTAYEAALALDPKFSAPKINIARLETAAGRLDAAQAQLTAVLATDDRNIDALTDLGLVLERRGQLAEAQRLLEKADDVAGPNNVTAGLALVDFHLRQRQPEQAREASKRLTTKQPEALHVLLALARVHLANGDTTGARNTLTRAGTLSNYDAAVLLRIALLQIQAGHLPGAAYTLGKALDVRPDFVPAQAVMAEVEIRQGEVAKGELRARQIATRQPRLGVGHGLLGDAAMARNQPGAAIEHYRRSHQVEPGTESLLRLFRATAAASGGAAANALAEQWLKEKPNDLLVRRVLADSQARSGNYAAARKSYEVLVSQQPDDAEALNNLANLLILQGDPAAALKAAERAMARSPGAPHIIGTTGWAAFKAGQTDRALQLLRDARLRDPANPDTRFFLGSVLASTGRAAEARAELEASLKPSNRPFFMAKQAQELLSTLR